jgi:hypothetical protein
MLLEALLLEAPGFFIDKLEPAIGIAELDARCRRRASDM